jgi:hypothetical protein
VVLQTTPKRLGESDDEKHRNHERVAGPAHRRFEQRQTAPDSSREQAEPEMESVGLRDSPKADGKSDEEQK